MKQLILVAGATGNLGERIVKALLNKGAGVRIILRAGASYDKIKHFEVLGIKVLVLKQWTVEEIAKACEGVSCVVSVLSGLREVIIDAQKILLDAAVQAEVPRFIPSDYSLDFTKFSPGENRNLDLRREFHTYLDKAPIAATSVFNGAFTELLSGQMPLILFKQKRILYWGDADHKYVFTTMDDTAYYTAEVALDTTAPRYLRIAGDKINPNQLHYELFKITGENFKLFRAGGARLLNLFIKIARTISPSKTVLYPAWQGMQYMHNMIDKRSELASFDNERYYTMPWTKARDVLTNDNLKKLRKSRRGSK